MSKFSKTFSKLFQGVSQQSPELRLDGQCEESVNCKMTIVRGLEKRPSADLVGTISTTLGSDAKVHKINRDNNEKYIMTFSESGTLVVFDLEGNTYPVIEQNNAFTYLGTQDSNGDLKPLEHIRTATVADYTILVNKNVLPAMDSGNLSPTQGISGLVWVKTFTSNSKSVIVDGTAKSDSTSSTTSSASALRSAVNGISGYTATMVESPSSVFKVVKDDGTDFNLQADDAGGGTYIKTTKSTGADKSDLPPIAPDGYVVKIESEDNVDASYYLKYSASKNVWRETVGPEEEYKFDASTMPHRITRRQDDVSGTVTGTPYQIYFEIDQIEWEEKTVGDSEVTPNPSFIGNTIEDVFFFKSKLCFLSGENVATSRTDDFFNFFPTTALEVLDDDPIDINTSVSIDSVVNLRYGVPTNEAITLFALEQQFSLHSGDKKFTPDNVIIDPTTNYPTDGNIAPVRLGSSVYFVSPREVYSSVREYAIQADTLISDASDLTGHVPRYLPRDIKQLIGSNNMEWAFCIPKDDTNTLFVYKYFWHGNEKVQSSWYKWNFSWMNIIGGATFDGSLYLIGTEGGEADQTVLVKVDLENSFEEPDNTDLRQLTTHLDRLEFPAYVYKDTDDNLKVQISISPKISSIAESLSDVVLVDRETGIGYTLESVDGSTLTFTVDTDHPLPSDLPAFVDNQPLIVGYYTLGGSYIQQ